MNQTLLATAISVALISFSPASMATSLTLNSSIDGTYLNSGSHNGLFDGTSVLPLNYQINSASYVFNFSDDQDSVISQTIDNGISISQYLYIRTDFSGADYYSTYERSSISRKTVQQNGESEAVSVSLGGKDVGSGSTTIASSSITGSPVYTNQTLDTWNGSPGYYYSCGNNSCWASGNINGYYTNHFTQTTTSSTDWSGTFSLSGNITDQSVLDQILNTGLLPFALGVTGDLSLTSARLTLDYSEIAFAPANTNSIPEPSSLLLGLAGLGGLRLVRRRRSF